MTTPSDADNPTVETTSQALQEAQKGNGEGNVDTTAEETAEQPVSQPKFGGLTPQEAGRRSAQLRRERERASEEAALDHSDGRVLMLRTPVHLGNIVSALNQRAQKGDTAAARELREWMREYPSDDETDIAALDARTQRELLNRVLAEIIEDEGRPPALPLGSGREP